MLLLLLLGGTGDPPIPRSASRIRMVLFVLLNFNAEFRPWLFVGLAVIFCGGIVFTFLSVELFFVLSPNTLHTILSSTFL